MKHFNRFSPLNESVIMNNLFEANNPNQIKPCDKSAYAELKDSLDDISDYLNLEIKDKKFDNKKCIKLVTKEEIDFIAQKFKIKSSSTLVLKDITLDWNMWYEGAYDELEGVYDEDDIDDDMITDTTRDNMMDYEECQPKICFKLNNKWYDFDPEEHDHKFDMLPYSFVEKIISCIK